VRFAVNERLMSVLANEEVGLLSKEYLWRCLVAVQTSEGPDLASTTPHLFWMIHREESPGIHPFNPLNLP